MSKHIGLDELAIQEGIRKPWETLLMMTKTAYGIYAFTHKDLERFAALVAGAEREACAKVVEQYTGAWSDEGYALASAIRARGEAEYKRGKQ